MIWFRLLSTLLCAYVAYLGLGVLTGLDSSMLMGPAGNPLRQVLAPQLYHYLGVINPAVGAVGLVLIGVALLVPIWRGALKPAKKKSKH